MDRFLVKGALGDPLGKRERESGGEGPAGLQGDQESGRKRLRAETPGNAGHLAGPGWQRIRAEGLSCDYTVLFGKAEADKIFQELEREVEYFTGEPGTVCACVLKTCLIKQVVCVRRDTDSGAINYR